MPQKTKINRKTQKLKSHWLRFCDFYGKHLGTITAVLVGASTLALFFSFLFRIFYTELPLLGPVPAPLFVVFAVTVLHVQVVHTLAKKEMYQHGILYVGGTILRIAQLGFGVVFTIFVGIAGTNYFIPNLQIEQTLSTIIILVYIFLYMLAVPLLFILVGHTTIPTYILAKLCLGVTMDNIHQLNRLKPSERQKHISKYFKWFEDGLHYCNAVMMKLPNHPRVKEIGVYYDRAYLVALTGTETELRDLSNNINESYKSLGKEAKDVDFRSFLKALQHISGRIAFEDESTQQLSELFETVPLSTRVMPKAKLVAALSVAIITLIAAIIQIMMYFQ